MLNNPARRQSIQTVGVAIRPQKRSVVAIRNFNICVYTKNVLNVVLQCCETVGTDLRDSSFAVLASLKLRGRAALAPGARRDINFVSGYQFRLPPGMQQPRIAWKLKIRFRMAQIPFNVWFGPAYDLAFFN